MLDKNCMLKLCDSTWQADPSPTCMLCTWEGINLCVFFGLYADLKQNETKYRWSFWIKSDLTDHFYKLHNEFNTLKTPERFIQSPGKPVWIFQKIMIRKVHVAVANNTHKCLNCPLYQITGVFSLSFLGYVVNLSTLIYVEYL